MLSCVGGRHGITEQRITRARAGANDNRVHITLYEMDSVECSVRHGLMMLLSYGDDWTRRWGSSAWGRHGIAQQRNTCARAGSRVHSYYIV